MSPQQESQGFESRHHPLPKVDSSEVFTGICKLAASAELHETIWRPMRCITCCDVQQCCLLAPFARSCGCRKCLWLTPTPVSLMHIAQALRVSVHTLESPADLMLQL